MTNWPGPFFSSSLISSPSAAKTPSNCFVPIPVFSARVSPLLESLGLAAFGAACWAMVVINVFGKGGSSIGSSGPRPQRRHGGPVLGEPRQG